MFCATNVYYSDTLNETVSYRQAKHHKHFYTMPIMIHSPSENSNDSMCAPFLTWRTSMLQSISCHMFERVWQEMGCSIDVCCVTNRKQIEPLSTATHSFSYMYFLTVLTKYMLLEVITSSVKTLYITQSLLFIPAKCTYYVKYIYLSPITTCFGVCHTIFRETIALLYAKA